MKIKMIFNESNKKKVLNGVKCATSRYKKKGEIGDTFDVDEKCFYLDCVAKLPLWFISKYHHVQEGCISKDEFKGIWITIYNAKGWRRDDLVWFHHFKEVIKVADR